MQKELVGSTNTRYRADPLYIPGSIVEHRFVISQLAKRAILGRYRGTVLGLLWSLVTPLLLLAAGVVCSAAAPLATDAADVTELAMLPSFTLYSRHH